MIDLCAAAAARLQPAFDANLALFEKLGFPPEALETMDLVTASAELERIPDGLPVVTMTATHLELQRQAGSPRAIRSRLEALGAGDIVLAVEGKTPWPTVVQLLKALPTGTRVHLAFSVDSSTTRIGDPAAVQQLLAGGVAAFRDRGRDMAQRCPAVGDLFMVRTDDLVDVFARYAVAALRACGCSVSAADLSNVYQAFIVRGYVAGRTFRTTPAGTSLGGAESATFADVAPSFMALSPDANVSPR